MVFLLLSPHKVSVQRQNRTPRLYSSGTRSRKRRNDRWHLCWLHLLVPGIGFVQASTYSDRRLPHFSYKPQSCAAFKHWFSPPSCMKDEAGGVRRIDQEKIFIPRIRTAFLNISVHTWDFKSVLVIGSGFHALFAKT